MPSAALSQWKTDRAARLDRLVAAHRTVRGVDRRWITDELNHSLILRLCTEFQGYARELHNEAAEAVVAALAPNDSTLQDILSVPYGANRRLDSGNAGPETLARDFDLFGLKMWADLDSRYPTKGPRWRKDLAVLNAVRNGLAHDDRRRLSSVLSTGWTTKLPHALRWRRMLDGLTRGIDHVVGEHLKKNLRVPSW
jgi:hypothetical protein